jgi:hypothetical protein
MRAATAQQNAPVNAANAGQPAPAAAAAAQPSMFNSFKNGVNSLFSKKSANSLAGISKMRGNTSDQASKSATNAKAALDVATQLAGDVAKKEEEVKELEREAQEKKLERDGAAAAAVAAASAAADKFAADQAAAVAAFEEQKRAAEKKEADEATARQAAAAKADDESKANIKAILAEIKQAKEDLLALARRANVQANAASEMAKLASDKRMVNYANPRANGLNGSEMEPIKTKLKANLNDVSAANAASAAQTASSGGRRRRKTRRVRRAAKKHGTKRR